MEAISRRVWLAACAALPFLRPMLPGAQDLDEHADMAYFRRKLCEPLHFPQLAYDYTKVEPRTIDIDGVPTVCYAHRCVLEVPGWSQMRRLLTKEAWFRGGQLEVTSYVPRDDTATEIICTHDGKLLLRYDTVSEFAVLQLDADGSYMCTLSVKDGKVCGTKDQWRGKYALFDHADLIA